MGKSQKQNETMLTVRDNELVVSTWLISKKMDIKHSNIKNVIKRKKIDVFDTVLITACGNKSDEKTDQKESFGRPIEEIFLNERNALLLCVSLRKSSKEVDDFRASLIDDFIKQRKAIDRLLITIRANQQNAAWLEQRRTGKIDRRVETDAIKKFIEYCKAQGSENSGKYYMAISNMENKCLFLNLMKKEYKNLRDVVSGISLHKLQMADRIVAKALEEGMEKGMYYKDIFQMAKARVESFADLVGRDEILIEQQKVIE